MIECHDFSEAKSLYTDLPLGNLRIVLTGNGRVSNGSAEVLEAMGIQKVSPEAFLKNSPEGPVYTQLDLQDMYFHPDHEGFNAQHYYQNFKEYKTRFKPYTKCTDLMINGIYWEPGVPAFFKRDQMKHPDFTIQVIADITCDIAPDSSIPSTLRPSTISNPIYGFDPVSGVETEPFQNGVVDVMAVDNLPNELPRDASEDFGNQFLQYVFPELQKASSAMLDRATIARDGQLTEPYFYLQDFVDGK
jgi:alanine dehydrogenase